MDELGFHSTLHRPGTLLDVGAHDGAFTLPFAALPASRVLAFEPLPAAFAAFLQVLMIDLVLAGDNAIVVGALAAGLTTEQRRKVIMIGVLAALVLRIIFALIVTQLLQIIGLILVGGLLLLWVAWKMWRESGTVGARIS